MARFTTILATLGITAALMPMCGHAQLPEWPTYHFDQRRSGNQEVDTALSDPAQVKNLHQVWEWSAPPRGPALKDFYASPIVENGILYIGNQNGEFYALDARTAKFLWMFPDPAKPRDPKPLSGKCGEYGAYGIQSSALFTQVNGRNTVIFGAPDPDPNTDGGNGSARLWALDAANGNVIWKSDVVARVSGCTSGAFPLVAPPGNTHPPEFHERIGYSAPLLLEWYPSPPGRSGPSASVYIGIHTGGEDPVGLGVVRAVDLYTGKAIPAFSFHANDGIASCNVGQCTHPEIGGGVWNAPTTEGTSVYFTTGNTRQWSSEVTPSQYPNNAPPPLNRGLSLVSVNRLTGKANWFFQPLPFILDNDPDWNAGVNAQFTDCGELLFSVMKDGWTYAVNAATGNCAWQFPDMGNAGCKFPVTDTHQHGPDGYRAPGATFGNVLVITTGGYSLPRDGLSNGNRGRLHALDSCAAGARGTKPGVRWIADIPSASGNDNSVGAPTVTNGIVYVGTDGGHVVAIADPSVVPPAGIRCDDTDFQDIGFCLVFGGGKLVPVPAQLADVTLKPGGDAARLRKEVVIAEEMLFVSSTTSTGGHVYGLSP